MHWGIGHEYVLEVAIGSQKHVVLTNPFFSFINLLLSSIVVSLLSSLPATFCEWLDCIEVSLPSFDFPCDPLCSVTVGLLPVLIFQKE